MAGKYLKARQLAKEIEKKAKRTAEKKEKAKEGIEEVENLIEESKKLGSDIENARSIIEEAKVKLDNRRFDDSLKKIDKALEEVRDANKNKIKDILQKVEELHKYISISGDEKPTSFNKIEEANNLLEEDKFEEAKNTAEEALVEAEKEVNTELEHEIEGFEKQLNFIKDLGEEDITEYESYLEEVGDYKGDNEYADAFDLLSEGFKEIDSKIEEYINEKIEDIKKEQKILRKQGGETQNVEELISKAKVKVKDNNFEESIELINKAEDDLEETSESIISTMIQELEDEIDNAKDIDIDKATIDEIEEKLNEVKSKDGFVTRYEIINETLDELDKVKFQKVLRTIAESRENFIKAKEIGIDISEPMDLLNKARSSLKDGKHKKALEWAEAGREKINDLVRDFKDLEDDIDKTKEEIKELRDLEIPLEETDELISDIDKNLDNNEYAKARENLKQVQEIIDEQAYDKIMDMIEEIEVNILTADRIGLDTDEYSEYLQNAIDYSKDEEYVKAGNEVKEGIDEVVSDMETYLQDSIEEAIDLLNKSENSIENISKSEIQKIKDLTNASRQKLEEGNYRDSYDKISECEEQLREWNIGKANESISEVQKLVEFVEERGIEVDQLEEYKSQIEVAKSELDDENYSESINLSEEIKTKLKNKLSEKADKYFNKSKIEVVKGKKIGVPIGEMRDELIESKKSMKKGDYISAIKKALSVKEKAISSRNKKEKLDEMVLEAQSKLKELGKQIGTERISDIDNKIKRSKQKIKTGEYSKVEEMIEEINQDIILEKEKQNYENVIDDIEKILSSADEILVEVDDLEEDIDEIKNLAQKENDYKKATDKLKEVQKIIEEKMKNSVEPRIENTRDIIKSAKKVGINLSEQERMLEEAEELLRDENYVDAVEKIMDCQNKIEEISNKSKRAAENVKNVKEKLEEAKDLNSKVDEAQKILTDAMKSLKKDNYDKAIEKAEEAERSIKESNDERVEKILSIFRDKIKEVKEEGIDTSLAEELMEKAENAKEDENYTEAINLAMQSEGELERIELQQDIAKRSISTTTKKLERATEKEISSPDSEKLLKEANEAFKSGFYVKAFDKAMKSGDILNNVIRYHDETLKLVNELTQVTKRADELDVDTTKVGAKIDSIQNQLDKDNYEDAYFVAKEAIDNLDVIRDNTIEVIKNEKEKVKSMADKGKDIGSALEKLSEAESNLDVGNLIEVFDLIVEAKNEYNSDLIEEYKKVMKRTRKLVRKASKFGSSVDEIKNYISEAEEYRNKDMEKALDKAKKALKSVEKTLEPYSPKIELELNGNLNPGTWNKIRILFRNSGRGVANKPNLVIEGGEMKGVDLPNRLRANKSIYLNTEIKPDSDKIEFIGSAIRIFDNKEVVTKIEKEVEEIGFERKKSEGGEKCSFCKGALKEGMDMVECQCGNFYHTSCAKRAEECPNCGTLFDIQEK